MTAAVRLAGVVVRAGGRAILGPVDLELLAGEYVLLVGPSGSGKSTLLRAIAGLAVPTQGTVELFGAPASNAARLTLAPNRRGVGFLFQGGALWPHMSVRKTLAFAFSCAGVPRAERASRSTKLLDEVELSGYEDRMPATLSGGERQRLALARALAVSPRLLLLDEPLGPLDAELRTSLLSTLGALHERHAWTTIHVTHDPAEAASVATRTVRLEAGQIARSARGDL